MTRVFTKKANEAKRAGDAGETKVDSDKGGLFMGKVKAFFANMFVGRSVPERDQVEVESKFVHAKDWNPRASYEMKPEPLLEQHENIRKATYFFAEQIAQQNGKHVPIDYHNNPIREGVRSEALTKHHLPGASEDVRQTIGQLLRHSPDRVKYMMDRNVLNNKVWNTGIPLSIGMPRLTRVVSYFATHVEGYEVSMDLFVFKNDIPEPCPTTGVYPSHALVA